MDDFPRLSAKERLILEMLLASPSSELYGLEMVTASGGALKRGTVYVTLERMTEKGFVESREVKEPGQAGLPRRLFRVTGMGRRAYQAWEMAQATWVGGGAL